MCIFLCIGGRCSLGSRVSSFSCFVTLVDHVEEARVSDVLGQVDWPKLCASEIPYEQYTALASLSCLPIFIPFIVSMYASWTILMCNFCITQLA